MYGHYPEYFDDRRTSCSRDFAVGLLLGRRRFDGRYSSPNPALAPEESFELLLELLDCSIFEELDDDLIDIEAELDDAKDALSTQKGTVKKSAKGAKRAKSQVVSVALPTETEVLQQKIDDYKRKRLECENTIALARKYLRQIDDALADKVNPILREDDEATSKHGGDKHITLTSLELWIDKTFPKGFRSDLERGASPVIEDPYDPADDQCDVNGLMNRRGRASLYLTLGVLIHLYVELAKEANALLKSQSELNETARKKRAPNIVMASGSFHSNGDVNDSGLAGIIVKGATAYGKSSPVPGQGQERILDRIEEAAKVRATKLDVIPPTGADTQVT